MEFDLLQISFTIQISDFLLFPCCLVGVLKRVKIECERSIFLFRFIILTARALANGRKKNAITVCEIWFFYDRIRSRCVANGNWVWFFFCCCCFTIALRWRRTTWTKLTCHRSMASDHRGCSRLSFPHKILHRVDFKLNRLIYFFTSICGASIKSKLICGVGFCGIRRHTFKSPATINLFVNCLIDDDGCTGEVEMRPILICFKNKIDKNPNAVRDDEMATMALNWHPMATLCDTITRMTTASHSVQTDANESESYGKILLCH